MASQKARPSSLRPSWSPSRGSALMSSSTISCPTHSSYVSFSSPLPVPFSVTLAFSLASLPHICIKSHQSYTWRSVSMYLFPSAMSVHSWNARCVAIIALATSCPWMRCSAPFALTWAFEVATRLIQFFGFSGLKSQQSDARLSKKDYIYTRRARERCCCPWRTGVAHLWLETRVHTCLSPPYSPARLSTHPPSDRNSSSATARSFSLS